VVTSTRPQFRNDIHALMDKPDDFVKVLPRPELFLRVVQPFNSDDPKVLKSCMLLQ
jgi:hypothetical protein